MTCPNCKQETTPALFCHACDAYLPNPPAGTRAGVARRFAALFLDIITFGLFMLVVIAISAAAGAGTNSSSLSFATFFWAFVAYIVFALWFLSQGKTPGKWLLGIRAADKKNGDRPGLGRMLVRETVGRFCSGLVGGLGYAWAIFDKDTQTWHDKIAGTVVLRRIAAAPARGQAL